MTVLNKKWTESDVICDAIGERTFRDAANWLNENLPETYQVSHATIYNWVTGVHEPQDVSIRALQQFYKTDDPRHQLGADLAAMRIRKMEVAMRAHWAGGMK